MKFKVNNVKSFFMFAFCVLIIIGLFGFFFLRFNKLDDNKCPLILGSAFYNDNYNYVKVEKTSYLAQKFDGNYYLYQKENNKTSKEKIGENPVVYNDGDYKVYLYGNAYQIKSSGDIVTLTGVTEIPKASPTKFYKLRDRKYLMVDSTLRTSDNSIKTSGYLIIELDKQGNATFANNELNIKTIKPMVLKGTTMSFDIANEKLIYNKKEINLKNIIGSTNAYKKDEGKDKDDKKDLPASGNSNNGVSGGSSDNSYYDEYLKNVIYSVNNLTNSVTEVNDKTDTSVKKGENYYDFSKYIALKNIESSVTTITVNYSVVDPNNEYQTVFIKVDDNMGITNKYYLNKNEVNYIIRDLMIEEVVEDVVNVKTKVPTCSVAVTRVATDNITFNVKITPEYKFESGNIHLYVDSNSSTLVAVNMDKAATESGFTSTMSFDNLGQLNVLRLEDLVYNGSSVNLDCSYRFVR